MKPKKLCSCEFAYVIGMAALVLGTALMERARLGMSTVVAPAYVLHLKLSQYFPAYSFGTSEYVLQAVLIFALCLALRRFKIGYLFSFVTAVIYGVTLDLCIRVVRYLPADTMAWRLVLYLAGLLICAIGVSFFFHTYLPPVAYELFVKELSKKLNVRIDRMKTAYDCISCLTAVLLSFLFFGFGHFEGVKAGTVFCAAVNGWLIGRVSAVIDARLVFHDALPWRDFFSN